MKKLFVSLVIIVVGFAFLLTGVLSAQAQEETPPDRVIHFFYSSTCPHCHAEQDFLDNTIEEKYPDVEIRRYEISETEHHDLLRELAQKAGAEQALGKVPLTFIGDTYILGFDRPETTGREIEQAIETQFFSATSSRPTSTQNSTDGQNTVSFFGYTLDPTTLALPVAAITLGLIDGFNVCSLGALILILGIVITLKSRRKIILYGGAFLLVSAVVYGFLIFLWHQLFAYVVPFKLIMEIVLAALGIGGGFYFLKEYFRFKRYGVTCTSSESPFISDASRWIQDLFRKRTSVLGLFGAIIAFATILTIVEFPCSAVIPGIFAGMLASAELSPLVSVGYIALFVLFYLLDELIIFGIAVYKLHIWLMSPRFTTWAALVEGIALLSIGLYYALSIISGITM